MALPRMSLEEEVESLKQILNNRNITIDNLYASNTDELVIKGRKSSEDFVWFRGNVIHPLEHVLEKHKKHTGWEHGKYQLVAAKDYFAIRGTFSWSLDEENIPLEVLHPNSGWLSIRPSDLLGNGEAAEIAQDRARHGRLPWLLGQELVSESELEKMRSRKDVKHLTVHIIPGSQGEISYVLICDNNGEVRNRRGIHTHSWHSDNPEQSIICRVGDDLWTSWINERGDHELYKNGSKKDCWDQYIGPQDEFLRTIFDIGGQPLFLTTPISSITRQGYVPNHDDSSIWWQGKRIMQNEEICYTPANFKGKPLCMGASGKVYWGHEVIHENLKTYLSCRQQQVLSSPDKQHYAAWDENSIILDGKQYSLGSINCARPDSDNTEAEGWNWSIDWIGPSPAFVIDGSSVWWNRRFIPFSRKKCEAKGIETSYSEILNCNGELALLFHRKYRNKKRSWLWYKNNIQDMPNDIDALTWSDGKIVAAIPRENTVWIEGKLRQHNHVSHFRTLTETGLPPRITIIGADEDSTTIYTPQGITRIEGKIIRDDSDVEDIKKMLKDSPNSLASERIYETPKWELNGFILPLQNGICALSDYGHPSFYYGSNVIVVCNYGQKANAQTHNKSWQRIGREQWEFPEVSMNWPKPIDQKNMAMDLETRLQELFPDADPESTSEVIRRIPEEYEKLEKVADNTATGVVLRLPLIVGNKKIDMYCKIGSNKDELAREHRVLGIGRRIPILKPILPEAIWHYDESTSPLAALMTVSTQTPREDISGEILEYKRLRDRVLSPLLEQHKPDALLLQHLNVMFNLALLNAHLGKLAYEPLVRDCPARPYSRDFLESRSAPSELLGLFVRVEPFLKEIEAWERANASVVGHGDFSAINLWQGPSPDIISVGDWARTRICSPAFDIAKYFTGAPELLETVILPAYTHCYNKIAKKDMLLRAQELFVPTIGHIIGQNANRAAFCRLHGKNEKADLYTEIVKEYSRCQLKL